MLAYEIIDKTMGKGEADELEKLTGKSHDLFHSYRRPPRTSESPLATGNYSPLHHYMQFYRWRRAANPEGALKMQRLLCRELQAELVEETQDQDLLSLLIQILTKVTETINQVGASHIEDAQQKDLSLLDDLINDADERLQTARARIRAEQIRRKVILKRVS